MASVITQKISRHHGNFPSFPNPFSLLTRNTSYVKGKKPKRGTIKHRNLIDSKCESLAARDFLRFQKPYEPPPDVEKKINQIFTSSLGSNFTFGDAVSRTDKYFLLNKCFKAFDHSVPNSMLHKMKTINDIVKFYMTPVSTKTPYDKLISMDLPPNLHILPDYVRFNKEMDTKFDGISAFPESPTIVTGLRARKKYKSQQSDLPWTYHNEAFYLRDKMKYEQ